jgi:hypothetical protein
MIDVIINPLNVNKKAVLRKLSGLVRTIRLLVYDYREHKSCKLKEGFIDQKMRGVRCGIDMIRLL